MRVIITPIQHSMAMEVGGKLTVTVEKVRHQIREIPANNLDFFQNKKRG